MVTIYENSEVAAWAVREVQQRMAERHGPRDGLFHASEMFQCSRKTILQRTLPPVSLAADTILRFAVGQALQEFFLGPEENGVEAFGIILSADRLVKGQVLEFKSTRMSYEAAPKDENGKAVRGAPKVRFDLETNPYTQEWITRCRAYCAAHGVRKAHIIVFFIFQTVMSAWTLQFTDEELADAKREMESQRDYLQAHLDANTVPPVTTRRGAWECTNCPFLAKYCVGELYTLGLDLEKGE